MSNLEALKVFIPVVEGAIVKLGVPVDMCRTENPLLWSLKRGSAHVLIQLKETAAFAGTKGILVIFSPIMEVPQDAALKASLLEELMEMNHMASLTSFSMSEGFIFLLSNRFVEGMDSQEVLDILQEIGVYADYYDNELQAKYGNLIVNKE